MHDTTDTIYKTSKCKRCGSQTVNWHQSPKTAKWYLTEVFTHEDNELRTDYRDFHSTYCGKPELHEAKQTEIAMVAAQKQARRDEAKAAQELKLRRAEDAATDAVLRWYQMTPAEIRERLPLVEAELAEDERKLAVETAPHNRYTMDDFHEMNKQLARIHALKVRINFLTAERDVLTARLENAQ